MRIKWLTRLPPEIWVLVFSYLNKEEMHAVRLCCRDLRDLVDHPSLWRKYMLVLFNLSHYNQQFWNTLKNRRVLRVAVRNLKPREWRRLIESLPSLTTVVCFSERQQYKKKHLVHLPNFPNLKTLGIRNITWDEPILLHCQTEHLAEQLTHLSVCHVELLNITEFINSVSRMVNLEYLLFHPHDDEEVETIRSVPHNVFHKLLLSLKKLKHLSWGFKQAPIVPLPDDYFYPSDPEKPGVYGGPALTTLALVNYSETILSENALRGLTLLRSLSVCYRYLKIGIKCHLQSWLSHLQQLESLTIIGRNTLASYTTTFPPHVTRLALRVAISLKELSSIAGKVKKLEHLDMDQNRFSGSLWKRLSTLFPQLKTLRIRFLGEEPKRDLLILNKLRHLERLELIVENSHILEAIRHGHPWPSPSLQELIRELRELSKNRFSVITTMRQRDLFQECDCAWEGDAKS